MSQPFLSEPDFFEKESKCSLLSCINHQNWLGKNPRQALSYGNRWLDSFDITRARDVDYDLSVPILQGDDEILRRDALRTFATEKYQDVLIIVLYKCKKKFGDYQQSLSYMAGFLLLFYDMGTTYKVLTILNSNPAYLANNWRGENVQCFIDGWILFDKLSDYLPELAEYFQEKNIAPDIIAISQKWFGGVFIQNIPCPYLLSIMNGFFKEGLVYIFRFSLCLLEVLQPLFLNKPLHKMQAIVRLLDGGVGGRVNASHIEQALAICQKNNDLLDNVLNFDLTEARSTAFHSHLRERLTMANYKEMCMPLVEDDLSEEEEDIIEDGVLSLQKCIQEQKINTEYLPQIMEQLMREMNLGEN